MAGQAAGRSSAEYLHSRKLEVFLNRMPNSAAVKLHQKAKCHPGSPQFRICPHTALQSHAISLPVLIFDPPPLEYAIDIEVSLTNSSFVEPIKEYFRNLPLPFSTNISDVEMTVSSVNITTGGLVVYFCILADILACQYSVSPMVSAAQ